MIKMFSDSQPFVYLTKRRTDGQTNTSNNHHTKDDLQAHLIFIPDYCLFTDCCRQDTKWTYACSLEILNLIGNRFQANSSFAGYSISHRKIFDRILLLSGKLFAH